MQKPTQWWPALVLSAASTWIAACDDRNETDVGRTAAPPPVDWREVKVAFRILHGGKDTAAVDLARANALWARCRIRFVEVDKKTIVQRDTEATTGTDLFLDLIPQREGAQSEADLLERQFVEKADEVPVYYLKGVGYRFDLDVTVWGGATVTRAKPMRVLVTSGMGVPRPRGAAAGRDIQPFPELLSHEFGHALSLDDVPADVQRLMYAQGVLWGLDRDAYRYLIDTDECTAARAAAALLSGAAPTGNRPDVGSGE